MDISLKKVGSFLAGGFVGQAAAAVAGLLLVRWMSVSDYAIYTVGMTIVGAISVLTRGGVQIGLAASLSQIWPDRIKAAEAVTGANRTRLFISALTMPPILIASWFLLERAEAGVTTRASVVAILAFYWLADTRSSVIDQVLYFDGKAVRVQALDTAISVARVLCVVLLKLVSQVSATLALFTNFFAVLVRVPFVQIWVSRSLGSRRAKAPAKTARAIRKIALRQMPVDVFTVFQAQVAIFFLTRHGGGIELATFGALARIAQILTPFAALSLAFFVPAFATVRDRVGITILKYAALGGLPGLALIVCAWASPSFLLVFFGPAYAGQSWPLLVFALALTFTNSVQVAWSLVSHRGWNRWGWLRIALGIVWIAVAPFLIPVETAAGSYIFNCGFSAITVLALVLELLSSQAAGEILLRRPTTGEG